MARMLLSADPTMADPLPILLLLNLSTDNPLNEDELREHLPEKDRSRVRFVRATDHHATPSERGSPALWYPYADAVVRMMVEARGLAKEVASVRYYVAGRAGLPLFAQLGCELSAWADVTFLNQRKDRTWDMLSWGTPSDPSDPPFFTVSGFEGSTDPGRVAVIIATSPPRQEEEARAYMALQEEAPVGMVTARANAAGGLGPSAGILDSGNARSAARELDELFTALPHRFPKATGLSLFIDGPASLAFMVGRALNPNVQSGSAWVPNHDGNRVEGGYIPALTLPYRIPLAGASMRGTPVAILHDPADATQLRSLLTVLEPEVRRGDLRLWHGGSVPLGTAIDEEARDHLERARLVLVLASADFLANEKQMARIARVLRSEKATGARCVPILVRDVDLDNSSLSGRQCLPRSGRPIKRTRNADEAWLQVKREILGLLPAGPGSAR